MNKENFEELYRQEHYKSLDLRHRLCTLCQSIEWDKDYALGLNIHDWWEANKDWWEAYEAWKPLNEDERRAIKNHIKDLPIEDTPE